jgi:hypothetical protein
MATEEVACPSRFSWKRPMTAHGRLERIMNSIAEESANASHGKLIALMPSFLMERLWELKK